MPALTLEEASRIEDKVKMVKKIYKMGDAGLLYAGMRFNLVNEHSEGWGTYSGDIQTIIGSYGFQITNTTGDQWTLTAL
jgi:hypothetical protein